MTREEFINFDISVRKGTNVDINKAATLIWDYIEDTDKEKYNKYRDHFPLIAQHPIFPMLLSNILTGVLKHFEIKNNIIIITKDDKFITLY